VGPNKLTKRILWAHLMNETQNGRHLPPFSKFAPGVPVNDQAILSHGDRIVENAVPHLFEFIDSGRGNR
jgi:hypothetical protein